MQEIFCTRRRSRRCAVPEMRVRLTAPAPSSVRAKIQSRLNEELVMYKTSVAVVFALGLAASCSVAVAASSPIGIWIDHTGRGAVEITDCNGKLCGHLVWFKDGKHSMEGCKFHIIGNVRPF